MSTAPIKPRRYQDFLTPAWHRKFTAAAMVTLGICYLDALSMANWNRFWFWIPFSMTGIVCLLLFISALPVFVIRIAATHVGSRTIPEPLQSFRVTTLRFSTISVFAWYMFSAWWYSEVYRWTGNTDARVRWIEHGRGRDRNSDRLNERALVFSIFFVTLGIGQSVWHLFVDIDKAPLPTKPPGRQLYFGSKATTEATAKGREDVVSSPSSQIASKAPAMAVRAAQKTLVMLLVFAPLYYLVLREPMWNLVYSVFANISSLQRSPTPSGIHPAASLINRLSMQGILLVLTWDFANIAYDAHVSQGPFKHGKPLTDASKDPNGTLLVGLKSKRPFAKATAFWELAIVTARYPLRRATIYSELERPGGSTLNQIIGICMEELQAIQRRIAAPQQKPSPLAAEESPESLEPATMLPPLKSGNVLVTTPPPVTASGRALRVASSLAKEVGQHPGGALTPIKLVAAAGEWTANKTSRQVKKLPYVAAAEHHAQAILSSRHQVSGALYNLIRAPVIGPLFRTTFSKRAAATVCGSPYTQTTVIVCAVEALANLAVFSLKEDNFGKASERVPDIIRLFSSTLTSINNYLASLPPHWTDVDFSEQDRTSVEEVNEVREALRCGLRDLLSGFGEYATSMGLDSRELRDARALTGPQDMTATAQAAAR